MEGSYGEPPTAMDYYELHWLEFMRWPYLPVRLPASEDEVHWEPASTDIELPPNLKFLYDLVEDVEADAAEHGFDDPYIYVTASRGWATPENPLNRPGWHCDGFGTEDLNYVWCDEFPTVWSPAPFEAISDDHIQSLDQFTRQATDHDIRVQLQPTLYRNPSVQIEPLRLYRFTPFVVHTAPMLHQMGRGGMRSFLKVSVSNHRYNLIGNSRNHELTYRWDMHPRDILRNDPHKAGLDYYEET